MSASIYTWFRGFFAARQLVRPNGQPLYAYHLSADEFESLRQVLIREFELHPCQPFKKSRILCAGYLLFGAALLSRTYENGAWRWRLIDGELNKEGFDQSDHADAVEIGAEYWNLGGFIQDEGKRYFGFVMLQAGIPVRALESESGWASKGINNCLRFLRRYAEAQESVFHQYIRTQIECPDSFDEDLFVKQLSTASVSLNRALKALSKISTEREMADQYEKIKKDFPSVGFEAKHLKRFLKARLEDESNDDGKVNVSRYVRWDPSGVSDPVLEVTASLSKGTEILSSDTLRAWFPNLAGPSSGANALVLLNNRVFLTLRRHSSEENQPISYSVFSSEKITFRKEEAAGVILAFMTWKGGSSEQVLFGNLSALDPDEPVLFIRRGDSNDWSLAGSGSINTPADHALVLLDDDAEVVFAENGTTQATDNSVVSRRFRSWIVHGGKSLSLCEIHNDVIIRQAGESFSIHLRRGDASDRSYWFKGSFAGLTAEGIQIFRGEPEIFCNGALIHPLWHLPNGQTISTGSLPAQVVLPLRAVHEENERTLKKMRCIVIPKCARTDICIKDGIIDLKNWGNVEASIDNPNIAVVKTESGLVFKCPRVDNQDDLKPFSVLLTPRNATAFGFWQFRMSFDYPQSIFAFKFQGEKLVRDKFVTIDEVRDVKAYAVTGTGAQQFDALLDMLPDNSDTISFGRDYRYELNIPINPYTSSGTATYEDFREPLFRLMRLAGRASTVSLRIRNASGAVKAHIHVTHQSENLRYHDKDDVIDCQITKAHALGFIPLLADEALSGEFSKTINPYEAIALDRFLPKRTQPWIAFELDDDKHRLRPLLIPPSDHHCNTNVSVVASELNDGVPTKGPGICDSELNDCSISEGLLHCKPFVYTPDPALLAKFEYLGISSLWQRRTLSAEDYKEAERITYEMLRNPSRPEWNAFDRLHKHLKRRGMALLSFWNVLQHDVPLALAFALALEILLPKESDSRSFVFSLGRYKTWRWDFISVAEFVRVLNLLREFLCRAGLSEDFIENQLLAILDLDVAASRPVFKTKLAYALLCGGFLSGRDFSWIPDRIKGLTDPFLIISRNGSNSADKLSELLRKDPVGARNQLRGAESPGYIGASDIYETLIELLNSNDSQALDFAHKCGVFQKLSENTRSDKYLRSVILADFAWARGYALSRKKPDLLFGLAERTNFYNIETIYGVNEQWTAWATSFACAMAAAYSYT